ncbi:hypothetical protein CHS0354_027373 [Potamilus streckersoni]|uniref:Type III pantothenate kinase n=1 Tax=Potamilus streckersoni TaxID=2493646 RepID=A0AAE0SQJ5_9BIVA|nr:hypothetical protein CHS0354_027373 [Potamilus streckersoni]
MDRLVNGYAGYKLFRCPLIIIDFGTATTFDLISGDGAYMGGIIIPGIKISLEALNLKTAQLPKIYPDKPSALIGRSTIESIRSGGYYGYICMINGLIDMLKQDLSEKYHFAPDAVKVIATGGFSHKLHKEIKKFDEILYDLTLFALLGNISAFETDDNSETLESFFEQLMSLNILP